MTLIAARQVADAVLYEGYLLYPYRASSSKNQVRWQFGILGPEGAEAAGVGELPSMAAEVLVEARGQVDLVVRFLQVQARVVQRREGDMWVPVESLDVDETRWIPYHEAVAREVPLLGLDTSRAHSLEVRFTGGEDVEELVAHGQLVGRLVRTRWPLRAELTVTPTPGSDPRLTRLRLGLENRTPWTGEDLPGWTPRDVAARASFVGTHLLLTAEGTEFVSLLEGPDWADADAKACHQERCWPVLIADDAGKDAVLVAPIILGDHPTIAPESAGDLFDATEIDEILTLRVMTMTDSEKADARGTDPRAAAILARCDAMSQEAMDLLHGARRPSEPSHDGAQPESDSVLINGTSVRQGSRVRLRPSRQADAQDIFLAGLSAVVARVYFDFDGQTHLAVRLEDDPGADLYDSTGRYYYFGPEELEPLPAKEAAR
jgi:hypothetical protein